MKKLKYLLFSILILTVHTTLHSLDVNREVTPILKDWGFPIIQQEIILGIFQNADAQGLDTQLLFSELKEQKIRNGGFYSASISLLQLSDRLYKLKVLKFPFEEDNTVRKNMLYLIDYFDLKQLENLASVINAKKLNTGDVKRLTETGVLMITGEILPEDCFSILYLMINKDQAGSAEISILKQILMRRKEYKISSLDLGKRIKKELLKSSSLQKIRYDLENEKR